MDIKKILRKKLIQSKYFHQESLIPLMFFERKVKNVLFFKCIFFVASQGEIFFSPSIWHFQLVVFLSSFKKRYTRGFFLLLFSITLLSSFHFQDNVFRMLINFFVVKKKKSNFFFVDCIQGLSASALRNGGF